MTIILPLKAFKVYSRSSCLLCGAKLLQTAMQKRLLTTLQKCSSLYSTACGFFSSGLLLTAFSSASAIKQP